MFPFKTISKTSDQDVNSLKRKMIRAKYNTQGSIERPEELTHGEQPKGSWFLFTFTNPA